MPAPTYNKPSASTSAVRRMVSLKLELPPSMMISPASSRGANCAINLSTASPAWIIRISLRGRLMLLTNSSGVYVPMMSVPSASFSMKRVTFEVVRLKTRHAKAVIAYIQGEILAHHRQADQADIRPDSPYCCPFAAGLSRTTL